MAWSIFKKLLLVHLVIILTMCTLISAMDQRKRHVSSYHQAQAETDYNSRKSPGGNNDFTTKPMQTISHGFMGGHMKIHETTVRTVEQEDDEAKWDDGLFLSSAGNGNEKKTSRDDDDDKKTLAQQVKEGKYGLIQNEISSNKSKRPGIISYLSNPEVPSDNKKNFGGLDKEDIWLAENHMLVLRGGKFPDHETEESNGDLQGWLPIDNYQAPKRQVRIPSQPKVPPPFPIQLTDGGPIKIIGNNEKSDSHENGSQWIPESLIPFNDTLVSSDENQRNETSRKNIPGDRKIKSDSINGGVVGPFFPSLPPGAVFVPPPSNQTDYDEDDQSIYYPPPYSFKYSSDNSTAVPPGPLVPGIILPPPPDFFSELKEKKSTVKSTKCPRCTVPTSSSNNPQKSSTKSYKVSSSSSSSSSSSTTSSTKAPHRSFTMKPVSKLKHRIVTVPFTEPADKTTENTLPYVEVTTPTSNKVNTLEISEIFTVRPVLNNQVIDAKTEGQKNRWSGGSSNLKPIVAYYRTTPATTYESVETTPAPVKNILITDKRPESLASYYFYAESNGETSGTTTKPTVYFQETTQTPYYKVQGQIIHKKRKPYYNIETTPSQSTAEEYNDEELEPVVKSSPRYQFSDSTKIPESSRIQGQRMLSQTSPLYYQSVTEQPKLTLQSLFTTPSTRGFTADNQNDDNRYEQKVKSKPVYQYSFQANNYYQRGRAEIYNEPEIQEQPQKPTVFNEWQDIQDEGQLYDYEENSEPTQQLHHQDRSHYKTRLPNNYETTTVRPSIVNTTPNPAHAYYTKQDEQLLDDVTREYFTNFGKKIKHQGLSSTTPIYGKSNVVTEKPNYITRNSFITNDYESRPSVAYKTPRVNVHYGDQSYSLKDDTQVNYNQPLPPINPDAEYLPEYEPNNDEAVQVQSQPIRNPYVQSNLSRQRLLPIIRYKNQQITQQSTGIAPTSFVPLNDGREKNNQRIYSGRPLSLSRDIAVNYRNPRPPINPDAELIDPATGQSENSGNPNSYFTYRLPGDGGHVYFLTPHAIAQRQENSGGYLRSRGSRPVRRRRGPGNV